MRFRYTLELLTLIAIVAFCVIFVYTSSMMNGTEFTGSDNAGTKLVADLTGKPEENFRPLVPQWVPPGREIESSLFALQAAVGGILVGGIFGYWIGQMKKP